MNNLSLDNLNTQIQLDAISSKGMVPNASQEMAAAREFVNQGGQAPVSSVSGSFAQMLEKSVDGVNVAQHQSDQAIKELTSGRTKNIHETMLTIERADTSLKLMMQVRNKILDAYREVMRMQV